MQKIAESIETLHENEDQGTRSLQQDEANSSCAFDRHARHIASGVWLERRAELEEAKNIGHTVENCQGVLKMKSVSACAVLRNRVEPAKHSKRKVLASIVEDMRTVLRDAALTTHSELVEYRVRFELSRE